MEQTQSEDIFEKNLAIFERFCPELVEPVKAADCKSYTFCTSESGDRNLKKGSDFYFHSLQNPKQEADLWFHSLYEINTANLIVVFGVGLAYYYTPLKKWLEKDLSRMVVFLEPDVSLLHLLFHMERGARLLEDPQVAVLGVRAETQEFRQGALDLIAHLMLHRLTQFSEIKAYAIGYHDVWSTMKKTVRFHAGEAALQANFMMPKTLQEHVLNAARNVWKLPESKLIYHLEGCLQGIPAIICGAGPSLVKDLPLLKKCKDAALIIGAGTGMNVLNKSGIIPFLGVAVDPYDTTRIRIMTNYAYEVPYCFKLSLNHEALALLHGATLYFKGSDSYGIETYLEDKLGLGTYPRLFSPLSSTHACLGLAAFLGCNPIAVLGVDLAYTDRKRYPDLVKGHSLDQSKEHMGPSGLYHQHILFAEAAGGGLVETRADWIREGSYFKKFKKKHPNVTLINATSQGLLLPEVEFINFNTFAKHDLQQTFDLDNIIHAAIQNSPCLNVTPDRIRGLMGEWKESLRETHRAINAILEELCRLSEEKGTYPSPAIETLCQTLHSGEMYRYILRDEENNFNKYFFHQKYPILYRPENFEENEKALAEIHYDIGLYMFLGYLTRVIETQLAENGEIASVPCVQGTEPIEKPDSAELNGRQLSYYDSGAVKTACSYQDGKLHGPSTFFSSEGRVLARGWFKRGKKEGKNLQYYASGHLYSIKRYQSGREHGRHDYFYESGKQKASMVFEQGVLDGSVRIFYPSGAVQREVDFKNGQMDGFERMWDSKGQLVLECDYAEGEPIGYARRWHSNGRLKEERKFYDSPDHFDDTRWNREGERIRHTLYIPEKMEGELERRSEAIRKGLQRVKERLNVKRNEI